MASEREWTVVTWNVHGASGPSTRDVAGVIAHEEPDIVALQEIRWYQAALLARRLRMHRTWALKHFPYSPLIPWLGEGMAILTPHQLAHPGVRIVSTGATVLTFRRRIAQWATIVRGRSGDADQLVLFNVHLSPDDLAEQRQAEASRVAALAQRRRGPLRLVIAGDLNDADEPAIVATLPAVEAQRPGFTNPADRPNQTLDHVLIPPDATHVSTSVPAGGPEWARLSDHLPVTVRFTV